VSQTVDTRVSKRYASALFAAAQKTAAVDVVQKDLDMLAGHWQSIPQLRQAMESPLLPDDKKLALIDKLFGKEVSPLTRSFLKVLVEKDRETILVHVQQEFRLQADSARGLLRAQASVAEPLDDTQQKALVAGLQKRTGKTIALEVNVDPGILGGVVVRLQDTVIDGSVRGSLERIREQMLAGR
jgi:F-type H+-transporting ATPase subunit delta